MTSAWAWPTCSFSERREVRQREQVAWEIWGRGQEPAREMKFALAPVEFEVFLGHPRGDVEE